MTSDQGRARDEAAWEMNHRRAVVMRGREAELAAVAAALGNLNRGRGQVLYVELSDQDRPVATGSWFRCCITS